jgi:hypothetical protein
MEEQFWKVRAQCDAPSMVCDADVGKEYGGNVSYNEGRQMTGFGCFEDNVGKSQ